MALDAAASTILGEAHSRPFLAQILVPGTTVLGQEGYHDSVMVDLSIHMSTTLLHARILLHTCHCPHAIAIGNMCCSRLAASLCAQGL